MKEILFSNLKVKSDIYWVRIISVSFAKATAYVKRTDKGWLSEGARHVTIDQPRKDGAIEFKKNTDDAIRNAPIYIEKSETTNEEISNEFSQEINETTTEKLSDISEPTAEPEVAEIPITEEIPAEEEKELYEGAKKNIVVNAYERSSDARAKCIARYGFNCTICNFDFAKIYGEMGEGFIHVHHIVPLSEIGENYKVDPIKDLCPVCPNCHAMLHKKFNGKCPSVDELGEIIVAQRERNRG